MPDRHWSDFICRAVGKPLCRLLLGSSVAVHIVATVGVVEQANGLPATPDAQLEHDRVSLQGTAIQLDQHACIRREGADEWIAHTAERISRFGQRFARFDKWDIDR